MTRVVKMRIDGELLTVHWDPDAFPQDLGLSLSQALDGPPSWEWARHLPAILCAVVRSWDLLEDDETPVPLTEESLSSLPADFLMQIVMGLVKDETRRRSPRPLQ